MRTEDARAAALHARMRSFRRKVDTAVTLIERTLDRHSPCFVAYSGGKDSTVLLWLARMVDPDIEARILLWPESELLGNFAENIASWRARGALIREVRLTRAHWTEKVANKWAVLNDAAPARSVLIGLRAQESAVRRMSLARHGLTHRRASDDRVRVCPLAWWTTRDIAAAIHAHDLPLLDRYEDDINVRTTTRIIVRPGLTEQMMNEMRNRDPASLHRLRSIYPDRETGGAAERDSG